MAEKKRPSVRQATIIDDPLTAEIRYMVRDFQSKLSEHGRELIGDRLKLFNAAVGAVYATCTLESFSRSIGDSHDDKRERAWQAIGRFVLRIMQNRRTEPITLMGPPGIGKDHLLVAAARLLVATGATLAWRRGWDLFKERREGFQFNREEEDVINRATRPDVLYLSDPAREEGRLASNQGDYLFAILDRRTRAGNRPTWMTLNAADANEAASMIGTAAFERIINGAVYLKCNWPTYRQPAEKHEC